jgi:hypothetical protein
MAWPAESPELPAGFCVCRIEGIMLPDFLGIGAQRAGTTWLYHCLNDHPQIGVAEQKELHFFDSGFDRGVEWYERQFPDSGQFDVVGEVTPNYLNHPDAPERIARILPEARLIAILREPVSRAYSAYELFRQKRYARQSFHEVCTVGSDLYNLGCYAGQLERFFEHFDRSQLGIWLYDELKAEPQTFLSQVYGFLGVDATFVPPSLRERANAILYPRTQKLLAGLGLGRAMEAAKASGFGRWLKRRLAGSARRPRADNVLTDAQQAEIQALFAPEVDRLEELLGRDLSAWRR